MYRIVLLAACAVLALPTLLAGQEVLCDINAPGRTEQRVEVGDTVIVLYDAFTVTCEDGARLEANSGRLFQANRELHLVGDVFFRDAARTLSAGEATYNAGTGRLWAIDEVVFENLEDRSTLRGPELEYLRATEFRPVAFVDATRRPTLTLPAGDDPEAEPLELTGDRVTIEGDDDLNAVGDVVITRTDLNASAEEAHYNSTTEELELRRDARIVSEEFLLAGDLVRARLIAGSIEEVRSTTNARLEGEDLEVTAPELHLFFAADLLERAVAWSMEEDGERANAISETFALVADSIDAGFIEQRVDIVHAIGNARGETIDTLAVEPGPFDFRLPAAEPDTIAPGEVTAPPGERPGILASDWIIGDTITGYFGPEDVALAAADTAGVAEVAAEGEPEIVLHRLLARGSAQSLYRMTPQGESVSSRPNVNFLVGEEIELELSRGELQVASVEGLQRGLYLEVLPEETGPEADEDDPVEEDAGVPVPPGIPVGEPPTPPIAGALIARGQ